MIITITIETDTLEKAIETVRDTANDLHDLEMKFPAGVWLAGVADEKSSYDMAVSWDECDSLV